MFPGGAVNRPTSMSPNSTLLAPSRTSAAGIPRAAARLLVIASSAALFTGCAVAPAHYAAMPGTRVAPTGRTMALPVPARVVAAPATEVVPSTVASVVPSCMSGETRDAEYSSLLLKSWLAADDTPAREWRAAAGLSPADTAALALATDPAQCARAAIAVSDHNREPFGELEITVYNVNSRYVVTWRDGAATGGWQSYLTFDAGWKHLATFGT